MIRNALNAIARRLKDVCQPGTTDPGLPAWRQLMASSSLTRHLGHDETTRLISLGQRFLRRKQVVGARGFSIDDDTRRLIALQACLPILNLGLRPYSSFSDVIVYESEFIVEHESVDEIGVQHASREILAGQTMIRGPVALAFSALEPWPGTTNLSPRRGKTQHANTSAPAPDGWQWPSLVVIHEFAHKIDEHFGLSSRGDSRATDPRARLARAVTSGFADFAARLDAVQARIPSDIDPESAAALPFFADLPLDPYAGSDPAEFLAVAVEAFFAGSPRLVKNYPQLHQALIDFLGQRPVLRDD